MKRRKFWHHKFRGVRVTQLMARDGSDCQICREPLDRHLQDPTDPRFVTFDHVVPRSAGGLDVLSNLRLAHRSCNAQRGTDPVMPEDES